jgi:hypothetical protein
LIVSDEQWPPLPAPKRPSHEVLWTLTKGTESRRAELRDRGAHGAELQIFVNGEFVSGKLYASHGIALAEAEGARDALEAVGFIEPTREP